jgi:hypothetical protein
MWDKVQLANLTQKRKVLILFGSAFLLSCSFINLSTTVSDKMKQDSTLMVCVMPIYLVMLTLNCVNAYLLSLNCKKLDIHYLLLVFGTVMFCILDNVLGRVIFADLEIGGSHKINSIVIMVTYYLGQYFIVLSISNIKNQ